MTPTRNFFLVKISKTLQNEKRKMIETSELGYLGVKYSEPQEGAKGVRVLFVEKDSAAYNVGFIEGDVITSINGEEVDTFQKMVDLVSKHPPGTTIEVGYISQLTGQPATKSPVLGSFRLNLQRGDDQVDMRFNLQFGEIVAIGTKAAELFPEPDLGDYLIFHHSVEYKERASGDKNHNDWHLIDKIKEEDDEYEYRVVHVEKEVFGVFKPNEAPEEAIIPYPTHIFCHTNIRKASMQRNNESGLWLPDSWEKSMEDYTQQLEDLQFQIQEMNTNSIMRQVDNEENYKQKDQIRRAIDKINRERRVITKKMHQKKLFDLTVLFINPKTNEEMRSDIEPGDKIMVDYGWIYPLDFFGNHYALARVGYIEAVIKQNEQ